MFNHYAILRIVAGQYSVLNWNPRETAEPQAIETFTSCCRRLCLRDRGRRFGFRPEPVAV